MTGNEFCELVGIEYETILNNRKSDANDNIMELARCLVDCDNFVAAFEMLGYTKAR